MNDTLDPRLQSFFADARQDLADDRFAAAVTARTRYKIYRLAGFLGGGLLILALSSWLFALPLLDFVMLASGALSVSLVDLGEGWMSWVLAPVNNVAGLLVAVWKIIRVGRRKLLGVS